jgi:small subunit ribosomal protein S5
MEQTHQKNRGNSRGGSGTPGKKGGDRSRPSFERPRPEFEQKILAIRRVTRVVSGGRRMSFAVAIAIGDKKGTVGVGTGKASDTSLAINKAVRSAKKNLIKVRTTKENSIPHQIEAKYSSARLMLMPNRGRGIVSGSAVRDIINLAGLQNITSKIFSGSKNKLNISRATIKALSTIAAKKVVEVKPAEVAEVIPQ